MKHLSKIVKTFEKLPLKDYVQKRLKHKTTASYFYPATQIAKCMMRDDALNLDIETVRIERTDKQHNPIPHVCDSDKIKPK